MVQSLVMMGDLALGVFYLDNLNVTDFEAEGFRFGILQQAWGKWEGGY